MSLQQVHLRINDAATGQPTPVRLRITDAGGVYYAPYGRLTDFATGMNQDVGGNVQIGSKKWAYIDGACEILLPPGTLHIEVSKGPEYKSIDEEIQLLAGKMSLRLPIERWSDLRKQGWYSGDARAHFLSPDAALLEGQAEDLAVVNLLARQTAGKDTAGCPIQMIPNVLSFSGQSFGRCEDGCGVAVNTFNSGSMQGSVGLLHCHRMVHPLTLDVLLTGDWTIADWCDQCHRKKGLVVWTNPRLLTAFFKFGEPLADLVLGKIDAIEITPSDASPFSTLDEFYQLSNADLAVPLIGASGKCDNTRPIGAMRTYAFLPVSQEFSYSSWIESIRLGRTFVTNGPLINFTINGEVPTHTCSIAAAAAPLQVRAEAKSAVRFDHLEFLWNGEVIETAAPSASFPYQAEVEYEFIVRESGWLAARCVTDRTHGTDQLPFAHSSAVAVRLAESPRWAQPAAVQGLLDELDGMLRWARTLPERPRLLRVLEEARTSLAKKRSP